VWRLDATLVLTEGVPPGVDALSVEAAAGERFDIAVATSWETTAHLFRVPAARYAFWTDHLAFRRMGTWQAERFAAQLAYDLPVDFIATGDWLAAELAELRPDARCAVVPRPRPELGPAPVPHEKLRVALGEREDERAAMEEARSEVELEVVDAVEDADVVVMLSPVDGALDAPLRGFAAGATCIVSSAPDAAGLVRHDENGIVADPDDVRGTARWLVTLARDPELLARLRAGAHATAASWPTAEDAATTLQGVLERLVAEEPPEATRWPVRLMGDAIGGAAVLRQELATLTGEVHRLQGDEAYRTAVAVRARLQHPRLGPVRRLGAALLRRARR
jgi:hypothetical protein